jgi:hypothetical protein
MDVPEIVSVAVSEVLVAEVISSPGANKLRHFP